MRIRIQNPAVRQNVEFLVNSLPPHPNPIKTEDAQAHMIFKASVHRETGEFLSDDMGVKLSGTSCKPIFIAYHYDEKIGAVTVDVDEGKENFLIKDMAPEARKVLKETLKVFNQVCAHLKGPSDISTKMQVLQHLIVDVDFPDKDRHLMICTWHPVDRMKGEELLWDKPVGTFFFRKDDFTRILENQLQGEKRADVKCFTLTFKEDEHKISDLILVHFDHHWQIYNDDPSLQAPRYSQLQEVLGAHASKFKFPLYG